MGFWLTHNPAGGNFLCFESLQDWFSHWFSHIVPVIGEVGLQRHVDCWIHFQRPGHFDGQTGAHARKPEEQALCALVATL